MRHQSQGSRRRGLHLLFRLLDVLMLLLNNVHDEATTEEDRRFIDVVVLVAEEDELGDCHLRRGS
jgi:hypothetical protein